MPTCKNDPSKKYKGNEPSPKGLGWCAHGEKEGKVRKGKDGNQWIVKKVKNGSKRWVKKVINKKKILIRSKSLTKKNKIYKLDKIKINKNSFRFKMNDDFKKVCPTLIDNYNNILSKKLKIKISNINCDKIGNILEKKQIQNKIVNRLIDYKKIPNKTINYFMKFGQYINNKDVLEDKIKKDDVIHIIYKFILLQYNKYSISNIDIMQIFNYGWKNNELDQEGPREYIHNELLKLAKKRLNNSKPILNKITGIFSF